jgi:5'-methylthioadenosine phosphorylase
MIIGIIGGSGLYDIDGFEMLDSIAVDTPYGHPSDKYTHYVYKGHDIYFLPRHGSKHSIAPHMINYRANIDGFARLGVDRILTISSVGGITGEAGDLVIPDGGIDNTSGRLSTYFDGDAVQHIDLTSPYCAGMREEILKAAASAWVAVTDGGVSICTNGPRMETAAEIHAYGLWGADVVGMTLFPECALARERGLCYSNISVITNLAAGRSKDKLTTDEIAETMSDATDKLKRILKQFFEGSLEYSCDCRNSLWGTKISK